VALATRLPTTRRCPSWARWRKRLRTLTRLLSAIRYERNERYAKSPGNALPVRGHSVASRTELDHALTAVGRIVIADTKTEMAVIEASITLTTSGPNETARKAAVTLALHEDAGYQSFAAAVREARANLYSAERRQTVAKQRISLLRAALALVGVPAVSRSAGATMCPYPCQASPTNAPYTAPRRHAAYSSARICAIPVNGYVCLTYKAGIWCMMERSDAA
jgi:hypothetical protein